ncbi:MAG: sulfatase [Planctomycetota bacterium]
MRRLRSELTAALGSALILAACEDGTSAPPHLVLFGVDTVRYDHTSLADYALDTTPRLAAWAAGGTVFERTYSGSSWTLPSVAMLFTGRLRSTNSGDLPTSSPTLPDLTRYAGYRNTAVVANGLLSEEKGYARRFDGFQLYTPTEPHGRNSWPGEAVVQAGLEGFDAGDGPQFLWMWLFDPHDPYQPRRAERFEPFDSAERRARFEAALPAAPRMELDDAAYAGIEARIARYDAELREADRAFGRLLDGLAERGLAEDTLVAFVSDHGEGLWQRAKLEGEEDKPNAFFPDLYFDHGVMLYEEQVRVPFALAGPGVSADQRRSEPVHLIDVAPTLVSLLGLDDPGTFDGLDLLGADAAALDRPLASFTSRGASLLSDGRYRLHVPREYRVERYGAQSELYDLQRDPGEVEPLDDADLSTRLNASLDVLRDLGAQRGGTRTLTPAERRTLEDLGYVGGEADRDGDTR